jgi:tetratricopeptide (TPR) repeat protein/tRNA A-37 threonylcarbamoyl transferase component Bud32
MVCQVCGAEARNGSFACAACGAAFAGAAAFDAATAFTRGPAADLATSAFTAPTRSSADATVGASLDPASVAVEPPADGPDGPLRIGQSFGPRYHIIRLLGSGGMGAVYQAWDAELALSVAIKVIRPEIVRDPHAAADVERRFKRELLLARQVTHKNVVRIHDLGEIEGIKYITMAYVNGTDLGTLLKRDGRLPVAIALPIVRSVVSGLLAAHAAGVVHRDLKPANIIVEKDGEALIMDFGIALSSGSAPPALPVAAVAMPAGLARLKARLDANTSVGTIVGTVTYMAPEQAKGQPVDQRADIYALGLILYDALVGRHRMEAAANAIDALQLRALEPPPPARSLVPDIPEALDRIITRCLQPDPAKRYQTTNELAADLERIDDRGEAIHMRRVVGLPLLAAVVALAAALLAGSFWYARTLIPAKQHDPLSVLIADFDNSTGDATLDGTVEPTLRRGLEGAGFITAFDRSRVRGTFGVTPPARMNEVVAREVAAKQGLAVVLAGTIARRGSGYEISLKAVQTINDKVIASARSQASDKEQIVATATRLAAAVRRALGDETSDAAQMFAMKSVSTTSLEVVKEYAAALEAQSDGKLPEARGHFQRAVELDPKFGLGYQGLAIMSRNLGRQQEAEQYSTEALKYLDGMTDRERFGVRAYYYRMTGDYQGCVKEYGEYTARYPADVNAHNNRVLCLSKLRSLREAVAEMQQTVRILPKRALFRSNLAVYSAYAGDFETTAREASAIQEPNDLATLALAFSALGRNDRREAADLYRKLAGISARGASWSAAGLGDLAVYEGRFADAAKIFQAGADADFAANNADRAARKLTSLAYARLLQGRPAPALSAAEKALAASKVMDLRLLAARIFVDAGATARAAAMAAEFEAELPAAPRAYGKIIEGEIALKTGDARQAIALFTEANGVLDTWFGLFDLGRAYLAAGAYAQADSAFDRCIQRRGEALSFLVDEEPTFGYFPPVYYYQGRVREGLNTGFVDSYLKIRGASSEDPLLADVRTRAGN